MKLWQRECSVMMTMVPPYDSEAVIIPERLLSRDRDAYSRCRTVARWWSWWPRGGAGGVDLPGNFTTDSLLLTG